MMHEQQEAEPRAHLRDYKRVQGNEQRPQWQTLPVASTGDTTPMEVMQNMFSMMSSMASAIGLQLQSQATTQLVQATPKQAIVGGAAAARPRVGDALAIVKYTPRDMWAGARTSWWTLTCRTRLPETASGVAHGQLQTVVGVTGPTVVTNGGITTRRKQAGGLPRRRVAGGRRTIPGAARGGAHAMKMLISGWARPRPRHPRRLGEKAETV